MTRFVLLTLAVLALGCSSTPRPNETVLNEDAPDWVYDPNMDWDEDDEPLAYYAVGRAPIFIDLDLAEEKAMADARADVLAFLEVTTQRLLESYVGEAGDRLREGSLSSLVNDAMYTRQLIDGTIGGARVQGKWWDEQNYYVWLRYDAGDAYLGEFQSSLAERLRAETRALTGKERDRMRDQLEKMVAERRQQGR